MKFKQTFIIQIKLKVFINSINDSYNKTYYLTNVIFYLKDYFYKMIKVQIRNL